MDVLLRKSPFCPELTHILDLEETETHYGKSFIMAHSVHGVKSGKLAISSVALLTPCMEVEIFCYQIPSFEVL